ncbi:4Fe-4S binding protein [Methanococcus maripaludis]|jgi:carbon-monoxide dehydrogenase iron sulfur subunit|uniref:Ferredoxin n=4 Tax=Methanococcus maripaludis TaxID=39152 RepID=A0A8T3W6D6_METMI|nr:4Fe-4S binding protein [Methanococcus maripaludis]AEK20523.1 hypothetical protein GYY_08350 [Methanococcus maripaludis X1]MBG0769099.1 4Fe-4S binding protein [Methanococcus maripaludis]BAP61843.1 pyruvate oxidoreductase cysteine-rich subunit 2 [Methanococcus maripaludis KA1]BAP63694.1 pyruvate oxidoreductase cysteine-rich subunit 2 [Methanococcus maripaludis OS7]
MKVMPNIDLCVDCKKCERACPINAIHVFDGIPIRCMHCEDAPCLNVCPEDAIEKIDDKVVVHPEKCVGCALCAEACPVGAIQIDRCTKVAVKCDGCIERGSEACLEVCPTKALDYYENTIENKRAELVSKLKKLTSRK